MNELKPCPFCGGNAWIERSQDKYYVKCLHTDKCYLVGRAPQKYNVREAAVKMWNRRTVNE